VEAPEWVGEGEVRGRGGEKVLVKRGDIEVGLLMC
jgi:hypothetical protein